MDKKTHKRCINYSRNFLLFIPHVPIWHTEGVWRRSKTPSFVGGYLSVITRPNTTQKKLKLPDLSLQGNGSPKRLTWSMSTEFLNQLFSVKCWEKFAPIYKLSIFDLDRVTDISTRRMKARELWRNFMFWNLENIVLWIWSERSSLTSSLGCPCKYSVFKYFVTSIWKKLINTSLYT